MPTNTVLFTSRAPIGYVAIALNPISTNQGFKSIVPYITDFSQFIALVMRTFAPKIDSMAPGTTFKEVSGKIVAGVPFPLPPLAEQRRIVTKVDELMSLCDKLEKAQLKKETTRNKFTKASLAKINQPNPATFLDDVHFVIKYIPSITTSVDQIKQLRQTILNLAVRGKLVAQDQNDEPANELLKRIRAKADNRKKPKVENDTVDTPPFSIPFGWEWTRLGKIGNWGSGSTPSRNNPDLYGGGITWLKSGELNDNMQLRGSKETVTELAVKNGSFRQNRPGDVLIAMYGATIGMLAILAACRT